MQDNLQALINAQVKDSLLDALTGYSGASDQVPTEEINNNYYRCEQSKYRIDP